LLSGNIQAMFQLVPGISGFIANKKVNALAVMSSRRSPILPDVPTMAEAGYPGLESYTWLCLMAPKGTPKAVIDRLNEGVNKLSGGNQQKVVLAKWMFTDPDLLILDEPTRGIDVGAKTEIYGIIRDLAASGKGIILISSELPELLGVSDRIYTIFEGAITNNLTAEEANPESLLRSMTSAKKKVDSQ